MARAGWICGGAETRMMWCMAKTRARIEASHTAQAPRIPIAPSIAWFLCDSVESTAYLEIPSIGELAVA